MSQPRAVVVGTGYAGVRHADALTALGIAFTGPLSAREVVRDPSPLRDRSVEVVHVCATNDLHVPLVGAALDAKKHVVCEKPLALDAATAQDLARRAEASGRLAVLGYNYRFLPMVVELVARVPALGAVHDVRGGFLQDWLLLASDTNWRTDAARGGASGVIADIGAHWIDLAELALGDRVEAVVAHVGRLHGRATEDHASFLVRFGGGLVGSCVLSHAAAGHRNDLELSIDGASGALTWRYERPDELWLGSREGSTTLTSPRSDANEGRRNLLAAVYARIGGDESPPVAPLPTFGDGVRHLRVAAAALESASTGAWVSLP